ncbi:MAG: histidinol-phosphate transaminase [Spirochaetaceae bacterium]|nr:MAG: histidinol-phosphate transaminase [Spirochaetaceae bacterium]
MNLSRIANKGTSAIKKYIPGKSVKEAQAELGIAEMIKLASNENAFGAAPSSVRSIRELADQIHVYPDSQSREIRFRLAEQLGVQAAEITTGNGADGVIYNLGMAVIDQGDEIIFPRITFPIYETISRVMRGIPVYSQMSDLHIDLADISRNIGERTKLVFLCNPNNPTGDALPPEEVKAFLQSVPDHVLVVLDEAYIDFTEGESRLDSVGIFRDGMSNLFILRSFSKIYGLAGLRFGYGIGDADLVALINLIKPPFDVSILAEQAAIEALEDREFVHSTVEGCSEEKRYFYEQLDKLGLQYIRSHTNFILIDTGQDAQEVFQALLLQGIIVRAATLYSLPNHIRVTIGQHAQNERFFEALREVLTI